MPSALNDQLAAARQERSELKAEISKAKRATEATFADRLAAANRKCSAIERQVKEAISADASHEWEGKRVYRMKSVGRAYARDYERVEGFVEVRRVGTEFPAGRERVVRPTIGRAFVRLAKKDGTAGKNIADLHGWKLVEESDNGAS